MGENGGPPSTLPSSSMSTKWAGSRLVSCSRPAPLVRSCARDSPPTSATATGVLRKAGSSAGSACMAAIPPSLWPVAPHARASPEADNVRAAATAAKAKRANDRLLVGDVQRRLQPADPGPDGRIAGEVEAALVGPSGIGDERNVGETERPGQEAAVRERPLHQRQRRPAASHQPFVEVRQRLAQVADLEPGDGDMGLVAILLPEHPLEHLG